MINLTDRPVSIAEGLDLDSRIRRALNRLYEAVDEKYDVRSWRMRRRDPSALSKQGDKSFAIYFDPEFLPAEPYGNDFIQALAAVAEIGPRNEGMGERFNNLVPFLACKTCPPAHIATKLKGFVKLALFAMWGERALVLPFNFMLGGSALKEQAGIITKFETEVAKFFRAYQEGVRHRPDTAPPLPASGQETLYWFGPRVIWTTDFHRFEDVSILEISRLHKALLDSKRGDREVSIGRSSPPMSLMLREMLVCHRERMTYSESDVDAYALWALRPSFQNFPFSEFLTRRAEIEREVGQVKKASKRAARTRAAITQPERDGKTEEKARALAILAARQDHEALVEYFCNMRGVVRNGHEWLRRGAPYPGREHIDLGELSSLWLEAWLAYARYRKTVRGFDSEAGPARAFNLLCDYLFLYLPWWKELFPENAIQLPLSPNRLKRGIFIHRTLLEDNESIPVEKLPMTFMDLLLLRQPSTDSRYGTLTTLIQFFEWLETGFEEDDRIAGKDFRSPLRKIDLPRVSGRKKTTKTPFSKRVYPHLLFYGYAVEAFGEYLQQVAMERPEVFEGKRLRQQKFFSTGPTLDQVDDNGRVSEEFLEDWPDNFGYVPFVRYRGKTYPISRVPNVFNWGERNIDLTRYLGADAGVARRWLPHLTTHRMLLGAVETGLRLQSLQWLDARTWDALNRRQGVPPVYSFNMTDYEYGRFAVWLTVSTDKTKDEAWDVLTVFRVRSCFYREQYFRESIREPDMDLVVDYDGINDSRFGQILPLFRSHCAPTPFGDTTYDRCWRGFLWGFEEHFNNHAADPGEFVQFVYVKGTDEEPVPDYSEMDVEHIRAIHTPHACRATYATNRTGILEASDVAQQLGHGSTIVTAHYTVSTPEIMEEKLAAVERELQAGFSSFDRSNPAYIRADSPKSALYKGFQENRAEAINAFQFAPAVALWSTEDLKGEMADGLLMLKNSPMSQIVFRETHICPVGESCPSEVLEKIGEPRRCGLCPLAMRCVDHLPAIAAKINQLKMKVRSDIKRAERLTEMAEPHTAVDALYDAAEMDANEVVGWQLSHDILLQMLQDRKTGSRQYHVESPEIVQKHLQLVSTNRTVSEFLLQRIADANAYPTMADPEIQRVAERFCRFLLAGNYLPSLDEDPVAALAGLIKTKMEPLGLTMRDLAAKVEQFEKMHVTAHTALIERRAFMLHNNEEAA